jgi:uncharacterized protein (DUF1778 family)
MATTIDDKDVRLNIRIRPEIKSRIERAATVSGKSITDFAISALSKTADEVLDHLHVTELSDRDRDTFLTILDRPSKPNAILKRASKTHTKLISK